MGQQPIAREDCHDRARREDLHALSGRRPAARARPRPRPISSEAPGWQLQDDGRAHRAHLPVQELPAGVRVRRPGRRSSPRPRAITPTSPSAGATPRSRSTPTRSKACTRTTSSWRPRSTALAAGRTDRSGRARLDRGTPAAPEARRWRRSQTIGIVGAGAWGTALAQAAAAPGAACCCSRATRRWSARSRGAGSIRAIWLMSRSSPRSARPPISRAMAAGRSLLLTVPAQALRGLARAAAAERRTAGDLRQGASRRRPAQRLSRGGGGRAAGQPGRGALGPQLRARGGGRPAGRDHARLRRSGARPARSPRR